MPRRPLHHMLAALIACAIVSVTTTHGGEQAPAEQPAPKDLRVSPAAAPVPALRYRLVPLEPLRTPGDAVPIYLRLGAEVQSQAFQELQEKSGKWLEVPLDEMPVAEARKLLGQWEHKLKQLEYGARRQYADWSYTLPEQREHAYNILLPDMQESRTWSRLLELKARVEIAEGKYDEAVRAIETGLAYSRHIAEAPFLISGLVAIAAANGMLDRVEELATRPGSPNLYWALTALPRPLVDLRSGIEFEQAMGEWILPELTDLDKPATAAEWEARLERLHGRMVQLLKTYQAGNEAGADMVKIMGYPRFRKALLEAARDTLDLKESDASDDEAIVRYVAARYRELRDEAFKDAYIPLPEAIGRHDAPKRAEPAADDPLALFPVLMPFVSGARTASARLERRVAALRLVEALRIQAAADGGKLPESLDALTAAPVPKDPATGESFNYRRDGDAALILPPPASLPATAIALPKPDVAYRVTVRE